MGKGGGGGGEWRSTKRNTEGELMRKTAGFAVGRRAHEIGRQEGGSKVVNRGLIVVYGKGCVLY